MQIKRAIKILNDLASMSKHGLNTELVIEDSQKQLFFTARPCLINVVDCSGIPGEFYREANNSDDEKDILNVVVIETSPI